MSFTGRRWRRFLHSGGRGTDVLAQRLSSRPSSRAFSLRETNRQDSRFARRSRPKGEPHGCGECTCRRRMREGCLVRGWLSLIRPYRDRCAIATPCRREKEKAMEVARKQRSELTSFAVENRFGALGGRAPDFGAARLHPGYVVAAAAGPCHSFIWKQRSFHLQWACWRPVWGLWAWALGVWRKDYRIRLPRHCNARLALQYR